MDTLVKRASKPMDGKKTSMDKMINYLMLNRTCNVEWKKAPTRTKG
jgi:hypothetical protein